MTTATPAIPAVTPHGDESHLWMPPRQLRRYALNKVATGAVMAAIFIGWMIVQWSIPAMRLLTGVLLVVTAWVVAGSIIDDRRRSRDRQVAVEHGSLIVTTPAERKVIGFADLHHGRWQLDTDNPGLELFDADRRVLAHLDLDILGDENEARLFLRWLRDRTGIALVVDWPAPPAPA